MFQRHVRFQVDISTISSSAGKNQSALNANEPNSPTSCTKDYLFAITFTLLSGNIRRFRRVCEHIQAQVCTRRPPPPSPRAQRKFTTEQLLSESSSCGSDSSELYLNTRQLNLLQLEGSDLESECSVFDVRTATREVGRRASTNNNTESLLEQTHQSGGSTKAVRSSSENADSCEKTCITTMSGTSIA